MSDRALFLLFGAALAACSSLPHVETSDSYDKEWAAARSYFMRANLRLYDYVLADDYDTLDVLVIGEKKRNSKEKDTVSNLASYGIAHARQALRLRPNGMDGLLYLALNLALSGLSKGKARAFLEGLPGKLSRAYETIIKIDRTFAAGAALRLKGRFLTLAPWPYDDLEEGLRALEECRRIAEVPQTLLYLGDAYHLAGRSDEAVAAWRRVLELPAHTSTEPLYERIQALARQRIEFPVDR